MNKVKKADLNFYFFLAKYTISCAISLQNGYECTFERPSPITLGTLRCRTATRRRRLCLQ